MNTSVESFRDKNAMAARAVGIFKAFYAKALKERGFMAVALSGGKTPLVFFKALAAQKRLNWGKIFFFFTDERLVRRDNKDSNFKSADDLLFSKAPVPPSNIFAVPASKGAEAAAAYENAINVFFRLDAPSFDLIMLGLGTDGHTASLFPGSPALKETGKLAVSVLAPAYARPRRRVTLTLKALNSARTALFLVSGRDKQEVFASLAAADKNLPASKIAPTEDLYLFYSK
ncbi:MAG: 6-phosphogluconolactonase [Elusimicrobiales bacterium]|jgi:6-phosphogluconolactonase